MQARQTAYKIWIRDLINGVYHKVQGEWEPNYVLARDMKISRVNIIANVVDKSSSEGYSYLELDDGSARIKVKAWKEDTSLLNDVPLGSLVLLIGRVREYNSEIYLTPEIIKQLSNLDWTKLRKLELSKKYGEPLDKDGAIVNTMEKVAMMKKSEEVSQEEKATQTTRQKILDIIGSSDEITYDELNEKSGLGEDEVEDIVKELIKEGEVYTPRPNYLRCI